MSNSPNTFPLKHHANRSYMQILKAQSPTLELIDIMLIYAKTFSRKFRFLPRNICALDVSAWNGNPTCLDSGSLVHPYSYPSARVTL